MAETTADVRRDIEMTRERMSSTLVQLEQKLNLTQVVKDHPIPALAIALGAGIMLSGSRADVKAASATLAATQGTSSKLGPVLDDLVAQLMTGVTQAFQSRVDSWVGEIKGAIGAPTDGAGSQSGQYRSGMSQQSGTSQGMSQAGSQGMPHERPVLDSSVSGSIDSTGSINRAD